MTVCYRCRILGRVQGVFFRGTTQQMARELGLTGYARNMPDASVEVLVCGSEKAVNELREWLWLGPTAARVERVDCQPVEIEQYKEFSTG